MVSAWYFCTDPNINKTNLVSPCVSPFTVFGEILDQMFLYASRLEQQHLAPNDNYFV